MRTRRPLPLGRFRRQRGLGMIEVLVASAILSTCIAAMTSLWYFAHRVTERTVDSAVAYNIGRQTLEDIKRAGFSNTAEAPASSPVVRYYTGNSASATTNTSARYKVTYTVVSDYLITGTSTPAEDAIRTVTVRVTNNRTGSLLFRGDCYLVKGGV